MADSNASSATVGNSAAGAPPNAIAPATNGTVPGGPTNNGVAAPPTPTLPEPKLPTRKDTSLKEFLNRMDDYAPIVCVFATLLFYSFYDHWTDQALPALPNICRFPTQ